MDDWPSVFLSHLLTLRTSRSKKPPPHQGAFSRLNDHFIPRPLRNIVISGNSNKPTRVLAADLKVLPLSEFISLGTPNWEVNLLKHLRNVSAAKSGTKSKWMARVTPQVNKAMYAFEEELPFL